MMQAASPVRYYMFPTVGQQPAWLGPLRAGDNADARRADTSQSVVADEHGLRLAPATNGPFSLASADGSLGRLVLPRGFAIDDRLRCYVVDRFADWLLTFDPAELPQSVSQPFRRAVRLPAPDTRPEGMRREWPLAATSRLLLTVSPYSGALLGYRYDDWTLAETECFPGGAIDVATAGDAVYCLTPSALQVQSSIGGSWRTVTWPRQPGQFTRLVVDVHGAPYLLGMNDRGVLCLWKLSWQAGGSQGSLEVVAVDRTQFPFPPVYAADCPDEDQPRQFVIPPELTCPCDRRMPKPLENLPWELAYSEISKDMFDEQSLSHGFVVSERAGRRVGLNEFQSWWRRRFTSSPSPAAGSPNLPEQQAPQPEFWISPKIDSALYECRWDAVEVELAALPPGTSVVLWTYTFNPSEPVLPTSNPNELDAQDPRGVRPPSEGGWAPGITITPSAQTGFESKLTRDFLVRSRPGQFLRLGVELLGDGFGTPLVRRLTARAPRHSYIDFLPAVMREDDASRDFLERFLAVFQADWDRLEAMIDGMHGAFNPQYAPAASLDWLESWLGVETSAKLSLKDRRRALTELSRLGFQPPEPVGPHGMTKLTTGGTRRGTARHLREHLSVVLASLAGLAPDEMRGFPWIIEGFRERACLTIGGRRRSVPDTRPEPPRVGDALAPPPAHVLWSSDVTGRLQLGVNSVLGERKLMPAVRPELDLYGAFAHRFRVVAPACWVSSPEALASLRTAIEREKPAHTAYELALIRPGVRIGFQSTVGIDTILGPWPPEATLSSAAPAAGLGQGVILPVDAEARPLRVGDSLGTVEL